MKNPENHTINRVLNSSDMLKSRGGRIRTYDLVVPNDARYRAALHPEK